ncbi:ABC transporter substrate-binding protein [Aquibaculum arenosum]|uniref:ABC transporter substrate-binding protein n=1 Tax=Aquibaculum arenosum TaxID=3032591 RepID=A0ABT5YIE2_9PROT|nr:ABC transporter substrate-binding protein [Fodinicurvata sp. CAU 1616]MDF2094608.1 ABC transporter substrate-binding protein [Fodinicurvata sp. CAU 1616]
MRFRSLLMAAGAVALAGGAFATQGEAQEPIRVAALYSLTGGLSSLDGPSLKGAELHVDQINEEGGVLGRPLELVVFDTRTDQQVTATAAQEAVSSDVVAGFGQSDTTFVMAAAPTFQDAGIPFVTSGATHPMLPTWVGENMFMAAFGDDDQSYAIADYSYDTLEHRRVYVWTDNSMDFTRALTAFFKERFEERGGEIIDEDFFMMGDTDFSAQIARLEAVEPTPDAVFISAIPSEAGLTIRQIREAGLDIPIISGDGFDSQLVATVPGPELANDVWFSTHTYLADDRPEVQEFIDAYEAKFDHPPENSFAPLGYDAIGLIANAIEAAGSDDPAAIRDALEATRDYPAVTGTVSYTRENMVPPKPVSIISVQNAEFKVEDIWRPE